MAWPHGGGHAPAGLLREAGGSLRAQPSPGSSPPGSRAREWPASSPPSEMALDPAGTGVGVVVRAWVRCSEVARLPRLAPPWARLLGFLLR